MMKKTYATFNAYEVDVFYVKPNHKKLDGAYGMTYFAESEIYIANNMPKHMLKRTLIHEFTHFALFAYDKGADNAAEEIALKNEEELCYLMERAMPAIYEQAYEIAEIFTEKA